VLEETDIATAQVGSHDPQFFALCLDQHKTVNVHTLLYHNPNGNRGQKISLQEGESFEKASLATLDELVAFSQLHTGDSGSWLKDYLSDWISQEAIYCLRDEGRLIALGELRPSPSQLGVADVGVIVHGDHRGKGMATRVVKALIHEAWAQQRTVIASTERQNLAAQKALAGAGLVTHHRMAEVSW
jgi:GNAT superfamily N-acetyltransferase